MDSEEKEDAEASFTLPFLQNQKRENLIPASVLFAKDVKVMSLLERQRNLPLKSSLRQQSNEEKESCVGLQMEIKRSNENVPKHLKWPVLT